MTEAVALPPSRRWTLDDLLRMPDTGTRNEIIDGALLMTPPPTVRHAGIAGNLYTSLLAAAPSELAVYAAGVGVQTGASVLVPDVVVADAVAAAAATGALQARDVGLVAEVLSPSNRTTDLVTKRSQYATAGIGHYWIIDPEVPSLTVLELHGDTYAETAVVQGTDAFEGARPFVVTVVPAALLDPPTGRAGRTG